MEGEVAEQLQLLRAQVETSVTMPGVLTISSACRGDGKSAIASGIAASMQAAGYRTLLLDVGSGADAVEPSGSPINLDQFADIGARPFALKSGEYGFDMVSLRRAALLASVSLTSLRKAFDACKRQYDIVIIDAPTIVDSNSGMLFARAADALLLTVRAKRRIVRADHETLRLLEREDVTFLGTVAVSVPAIRDARRRAVKQTWHVSPAGSPPVDSSASMRRQAVG